MTAIATASTKNCTNRMISRVKRKKIATIPTIPRNSGPKRVCRYVTSPVLLSATGGAVASRCVDIITPGVGNGGGAPDRVGGLAGSWRWPGPGGRCADRPDQPAGTVPDDSHRVAHGEFAGRGRRAGMGLVRLPADLPHHRDGQVPGRAGRRRNTDAADAGEPDGVAQAGDRAVTGGEPAELRPVAAGVGAEE